MQSVKEQMDTARFKAEAEVAEVILLRKDLGYQAIGKMFGISESTVKEIIKRRGVNPQRKRGPKPKKKSARKVEAIHGNS